METKYVNNTVLNVLPLKLRKAQLAIEFPEVQEIIKNLAKYNLGVYMPHLQNSENGNFEVLPDEQVQLENDLQISFVSREDSIKMNALPVGWIWKNDGLTNAAQCAMVCVKDDPTPEGASVHSYKHL